MSNPWKARVLAYKKKQAGEQERARDFMVLLAALPPGIVKLLLRNEACAQILQKYGMEEKQSG